MAAVDYRGVDKRGRHVVGRASDVVEFVEGRFTARWKWLSVERDGEEIGGIVDDEDTGQRVWWVADDEEG